MDRIITGQLSSLSVKKVLASDAGRYCNMDKKQLRRLQSGQGLVEYAVVIVLIVFVVIVAATAIGLVAQRMYGIIAGAAGAKHSTNTAAIAIDKAECQI